MGYNIARYCFYLAISAHPSIRRSSPLPSGSPPPVATPDEQRKRSSASSAPLPISCPARDGPAYCHSAFSALRCVRPDRFQHFSAARNSASIWRRSATSSHQLSSARSSSICCSIDIILLLILRKMKSRPVAGGPGQPPRSGREAGDGGADFLVGGVERSAAETA